MLLVQELIYLEHTQLLLSCKLHTLQEHLVMHMLLRVIFTFGVVLLGHQVETFKDLQVAQEQLVLQVRTQQ